MKQIALRLTVAISFIALTVTGLRAQSNIALGNLSVACLRENPGHAQELGSQVLMGVPVIILGRDGDWLKVKTIDGYTGYIIHHSLKQLSAEDYRNWKKSERAVFTALTEGKILSDSINGSAVSDIVPGSIVQLQKKGLRFAKVKLPDGRTGFLSVEDLTPLQEWMSQPFDESIIERYARASMGSPYLWGGNSSKGMDCSGLTYAGLWLNGRVVPRNASAQAKIGQPVSNSKDLQNGDLVFFASPTGRINHVGCYIGNNRYVESSGRVRLTERNPSQTKGYAFGRRINTLPSISRQPEILKFFVE